MLSTLCVQRLGATRDLEMPSGHYDPHKQVWIGLGYENGIPDVLMMGTGSSNTYSATTANGKDNDTDDRGT